MLSWITKNGRKKKLKEAHERELKKNLSKKALKFSKISSKTKTNFTEITIGGERLRVKKEHISIVDVTSGIPGGKE